LSQYRLKRPPQDAALQHTPRLSEEDRADLAEGVALFNVGKYWDAHEAWEKIWQRHQEPWRYFVQGLIQAAAAHHQLQRGIRRGAIKHVHNALVKLEAAPDDFGGLALENFRAYLHELLDKVERQKMENVPAPPQLRFV
jgi:predicted metal-dependent hydrolase